MIIQTKHVAASNEEKQSTALPEGVFKLALGAPQVCAWVGFLNRAPRIDGEPDWVGPAEQMELARWRDASRRAAWLHSRWLAKQMVLAQLPELPNDSDGLRTIQIVSRDQDGRAVRPQIDVQGQIQPWSLSIAHTDRLVLAALCTVPGPSLGVDLVIPEECKGSFDPWLTVSERAAVQQNPNAAATFWAIKEAVYKAIQRGESFAPRAIEVQNSASGFTCSYQGRTLGTACQIQTAKIARHLAVVAIINDSASVFSTASDLLLGTSGSEALACS